MIKPLLSIVLAGVVTATITGCGASPEVDVVFDERCKVENALAPKWACIPIVEGAYAGVGIASKSTAGMGHMRRVALANGRSDLAQQIQVQVKDKVETFTRVTGVTNNEVVDQVNTAVSKQVAKVDLQGSKGVNMWTAPSGTLYMLVTVSETTVNGEVKQAVKNSFKNDEALWQQFQSKNALEDLEKEFPTN